MDLSTKLEDRHPTQVNWMNIMTLTLNARMNVTVTEQRDTARVIRLYGISGPLPTLPLSARSHQLLLAGSELGGAKYGHLDLNANGSQLDGMLGA